MAASGVVDRRSSAGGVAGHQLAIAYPGARRASPRSAALALLGPRGIGLARLPRAAPPAPPAAPQEVAA